MADHRQLPPNQPDGHLAVKGTLTQKILIGVIVIGVGVLFGMSGSLTLLSEGGHQVQDLGHGVDSIQLRRHQSLLARVGELRYGAATMARFQGMLQGQALNQLQLAARAENEGLLPRGDERTQLLNDFLAEPVPTDPNRTFFDELTDLQGTDKAISLDELGEYLAIEQAAQAYRVRHLPQPVVARGSSELFGHLQRDQVETQEVVLSGQRFAAALRDEVAEDEAALQEAYDRLRFDRFEIPEAVAFVVFIADAVAIQAAVALPEADIADYYETHQDEFLANEQPAQPDTPDEADDTEDAASEPVYQSLEAVRDTIAARLREKRARALADELIHAFSHAAEEAGLSGPEADLSEILALAEATSLSADDDERLAEDIGLTIQRPVRAEKPSGNQTLYFTLPEANDQHLARLDKAAFFDREPGFLSLPLRASDNEDLHFIVRITERIPANFQSLEEVRDEVIDHVAAQRAYDQLLAEATALQEQATTAGDLAAFWNEERQDTWDSAVTTRTYQPLEELEHPAAEVDGIADPPQLAIELAAAETQGVILAAAPRQGEHYQVRLMQVTDYRRAELSDTDIDGLRSQYRRALSTYAGALFEQRLDTP